MEKVFETKEYVGALKQLVEEGKEVSLIVWGVSMTPFLGHARDRVFFSAPESDRMLKRGDIVFYQRDNGAFVMHRICRVSDDGFYMLGDSQTEIEGPICREQIFARITSAVRKDRHITESDLCWKFFAGPWITLRPLRPALTSAYLKLMRGKMKNHKE